MIKVEFVAFTKQKAVRKALDFWYKKYNKVLTLKDFISNCTWRKDEKEYVVIYFGPAPTE